jgi:hypothetical protein
MNKKSAIDAGFLLSGRPGSEVPFLLAAYNMAHFEALRNGCVHTSKYV